MIKDLIAGVAVIALTAGGMVGITAHGASEVNQPRADATPACITCHGEG